MMWTYSSSLTEIQNVIEDIFEKKLRLRIKLCDILDLSYDEYQILIDRIRNITTVEAVDKYTLSILVAWVTSYKFNRQDNFYEIIKQFVASMPQHHTRFVLDSINNSCSDYQIDTFEYSLASLHNIKKIIKLHAGL